MIPEEFRPTSAPQFRPLEYPGAWPESSVVITDSEMWPILNRDGGPLSWVSLPASRVGSCRVQIPSDSPTRARFSEAAAPHVVSILEELHAVSIDARVPLLAIGSNGSPSQLRNKLLDRDAPLVVPSIRAKVTGLAVGYSAFVAPYGSIPSTAFADPGATATVSVQWIDPILLRQIDASERPRYRRVWLDGREYPIHLETGEQLAGAYCYVADGGILGDATGPWKFAPATETSVSSLDQVDAIRRLLESESVSAAFGCTPAEFVSAGVDADSSAELFRSAGFVRNDGSLDGHADEMDRPVRRYGGLLPSLPASHDTADSVLVAPTPDGIRRDGNSVVRLPERLFSALGQPELVELTAVAIANQVGVAAPSTIATVLRRSSDEPDLPPDGVAEVDHVLRMAVGVAIGEPILIRPVQGEHSVVGDALLGRPNTLTMRVTLADPATAERDVILMSALSLALVGVGSGDYVILEGTGDDRGRLRTLRLKAFELPDAVAAERDRVTGGIWGARFPGPRETIGVHPDIPRVFVDSSVRAALGLTGRVLPTVRVRSARMQQFLGEVREMLIVLAVAFFGIAVLVPDPLIGAGIIVVLVAGAIALVVNRLRRRLSHGSSRLRR